MADYLPVETTRCGLLAKAISDEEEAAVFYDRIKNIVGRDNSDTVEEIILDEADHKQRFKRLYKALCVATSPDEIKMETVGETPVKESW